MKTSEVKNLVGVHPPPMGVICFSETYYHSSRPDIDGLRMLGMLVPSQLYHVIIVTTYQTTSGDACAYLYSRKDIVYSS